MIYILIIGLIVRLIALNQSLWLDEAILAQVVGNLNLHQIFIQYLPGDFNPPLVYLIELGWTKIFGLSEISLRMPSVVFGVATIWLIYQIALKLDFKKYSIIPALLLTFSGIHTYYSQEARMYSLATLGVAVSMLAIINNLKTSKQKILYFLFTLLAFYTHYLTWFILPAQFIYLLKIKSKNINKFFLINLAIFVCYLPWLSTLLNQLQLGSSVSQSAWGNVIGGPDLKNLILIPVKFLIGRVSLDNKTLYYSLLIIPLSLIVYLFIRARKSFFLFSWFFIPLILIFLISIKVPILSYFRLLFLLPAFYLIIIKGIITLKTKYRLFIIGFFLLINFLTTSAYLLLPQFHRENWRLLAKTLILKNSQNYPVVIIDAVSSPLRYYYAGDLLDFSNLNNSDLGEQFWLIPYAQAIFNPDFSWQKKIEQAGFIKTFEQHFIGDLTLIEYKR